MATWAHFSTKKTPPLVPWATRFSFFCCQDAKFCPQKNHLFVSFQASKEKESKLVEGTNHLLPSQCHKSFTSMT
jgi:hypothetical protein